jgi:antitoxin CptB
MHIKKDLNMTENSDTQLSKVLWHCRRGMLELDVMLQRFCTQVYSSLSLEQQQLFELLLEEADQDLQRWLVGAKPCEQSKFQDMLLVIRHMHIMSKDSQTA